jgi:chromate transporter
MITDLFLSFFKIGAFSFGGGYAMIPLMQKEIVEKHGFLTMQQFGDIIAIAEMTPGPISVNCATFVGYNVGGLFGAFISTLGVVAPSLLVVLILASVFINYQEDRRIRNIFMGIRPVVVALIVSAAFALGRIAIQDLRSIIIGVVVFMILRFRKIHPVLVVLAAGVFGILLYGL